MIVDLEVHNISTYLSLSWIVKQRLAIKRMNLQASKEFMAELKILTHVHHTNLVPYNFLPLITHP